MIHDPLHELNAASPLHLARGAIVALLYAGPDQILPLVSIAGAAIGFLLACWQRLTRLARRAWHVAVRQRRGGQ